MLMQRNIFIFKVSIKQPIRSLHAKHVNEIAVLGSPKFYLLNKLECSLISQEKFLHLFFRQQHKEVAPNFI